MSKSDILDTIRKEWYRRLSSGLSELVDPKLAELVNKKLIWFETLSIEQESWETKEIQVMNRTFRFENVDWVHVDNWEKRMMSFHDPKGNKYVEKVKVSPKTEYGVITEFIEGLKTWEQLIPIRMIEKGLPDWWRPPTEQERKNQKYQKLEKGVLWGVFPGYRSLDDFYNCDDYTILAFSSISDDSISVSGFSRFGEIKVNWAEAVSLIAVRDVSPKNEKAA